MSRIGERKLTLPEGVTVDVANNTVTVKGPKGELVLEKSELIEIKVEGTTLVTKQIKPSKRGELEITSLNDMYLSEGKLNAEILGGGFSWYDTGTFESQIQAAQSIRNYELNRGRVIACLEQIGYTNGWLSKEKLIERAELLSKNSYGQYLLSEASKK